MKALLIFILMSVQLNAFSQDCDCLAQYSFVKNYFESNNPAFQKIKSNPGLFAEYTKSEKKLAKKTAREKSNDRCNVYFEEYVALLKDHHSGIGLNLQRLNIDLDSQKAVDSFKSLPAYTSFKKMRLDSTELSRLESGSHDDVEGIYGNNGGIMLALIKTGPGSYTGVVTKKNKLLDVGHILFEFKRSREDSFRCIFHAGLMALNFQNIDRTVRIKDGKIPEIGFSKINITGSTGEKLYEFYGLDNSTNYLRLKSFDRSLKQELDSFYQSIDSDIQSKPYLVIDLRDNGGGAEGCYLSLVKYFYERPLEVDEVDVWVSPDNIRRYEEAGYSQQLIDRMKRSKPFTFIRQVENAKSTWAMSGTAYPKKVAILFNRTTASAAEGMITYAIQSSKVITLGENSGGYIGYGDVMATSIPCGKFILRSTTTKYHRNSRYEFAGIPPMHPLSPKQNWIEIAKSLLEKSLPGVKAQK